MTDWKTIKIPAAEYERHNAKRQNLGETWAEYIDGQAPEMETMDYGDIHAAAKAGAKEAIEEVQR